MSQALCWAMYVDHFISAYEIIIIVIIIFFPFSFSELGYLKPGFWVWSSGGKDLSPDQLSPIYKALQNISMPIFPEIRKYCYFRIPLKTRK